MNIDSTIEDSYRSNIALVGQLVTFSRISGQAPQTSRLSADVMAMVADYMPERTVLDVKREGSITQGVRHLIVVNSDLSSQGFTMPIRKNDKVSVGDEEFNVVRTDPNKRAIAGVTEVWAEGV